jgi:hypothetical protein
MKQASRDSVTGDLDAAVQLLGRSTAAEDRSLASSFAIIFSAPKAARCLTGSDADL